MRHLPTKEFTVFVPDATLDNYPDIEVPAKDYLVWFFKPGRAVLYLYTMIDIPRRYFTNTYKGHTEIKEKGFTVQTSKTGP